MGSEFESVLAEFKANERAEDIIPIVSDEGAQKFVVAWPKIIIRRTLIFPDPLPEEVGEVYGGEGREDHQCRLKSTAQLRRWLIRRWGMAWRW